jgi:two-component system response regulator (stage 0 sporulation protein A)
MEKQIRICIGDDNTELAKSLSKYLGENQRINVVKVCSNGKEILEFLNNYEVDFLIMDIIMPRIDGIGVLEKLQEDENIKKPNIIIVSAITHDNMKFKLFDLGVNYYMTKPLQVDILLKRIIEIYENDTEVLKQKREKGISSKLHEIGIYPNLVGYQYIRTAIEMLLEKPFLANNCRENIYSKIAKENQSVVFKVEKAINNAIHTSWNRDKEQLLSIFKNKIYMKKAPSSRIFITTIAEIIREEERKEEALI